jgi:S1-C subfamily serine protease
MAKEFLSRKGVPYVEKRVDEDYNAAMEMVRISQQQGVPVIVVDGQFVVGFDRPRLEALLGAATTGRPSFGASVADAARILSKQGQIPVFGAYVGKVAPGSPAERLGLAPGDIIVEMNVRPVTRAEDVSSALAAASPGSRIAVTWQRGDRRLSGQVSV